jgi:hypothetical protein
MDDYLSSIYYNLKRSGGFGGVEHLYKDVRKEVKFAISRKQIKEWLMKQDTYTLHKPMRRHFKRNSVIMGGIDQQWQMDLTDMQSMQKFNDGYRYLLVCIDVFPNMHGSPAEGQDWSHTCQSHILQSNITQASYSPEYLTPTQQIS